MTAAKRPAPASPWSLPPGLATGNCYLARCPSREMLDHILSRWGGLVLGSLLGGRKRYSALRAEIGGVSEKMLAQTLRTLERDGLVVRESLPVVPPHVEYELTPLGRECAERVDRLVTWIEERVVSIAGAQDRYDERLRAKAATPGGRALTARSRESAV